MRGQDVGCIEIIANNPLPSCLPGETRTLRATMPVSSTPRLTDSYRVDPISFNWKFLGRGDAPTGIVADDDWSGIINMQGSKPEPFEFCFFGRQYRQLLIGDNGTITFNIAGHPDSPAGAAYVPSSGSGFAFNTPIPSGPGYGPPYKNAIMMLQDLNMAAINPVPADAKIYYFTTGTYPCRAFVASWENVPHYQCGYAQGKQSYQMVLYESTNIIEIHVRNRTVCGFNSGSGLLGIQNAAGSVGLAPPGRNTGQWTATEEAYRFSPTGAQVATTYAWYLADTGGQPTGPVLGTGPTLNVAPLVTTNYVVVATIQTCNPARPLIYSAVTTAKVGEPAGKDAVDIFHCDTDLNALTFDIGSNTDVILDTASSTGALNPMDFEIFYYGSEIDALTDNDPFSYTPNETSLMLTVPPTPRTMEIWYSINDIVSNCRDTGSFKIGLLDCKVELIACDTDNDDTEVLDLNDYIALIDASNTGDNLTLSDYSYTFHTTEAEADDITTAWLPAEIEAATVVEGTQIFIRVQKISNPADYIVKFFDVQLKPTPGVTITGTTQVCDNATAVITIAGEPGSKVTYSNPSGVQPEITLDATGIFTITTPPVVSPNSYTYTLISATLITDGFTCSETLTQNAVVTVGGLPTAQIVTANTPGCEGDIITIDVQGTAGAIVDYIDHTGSPAQLTLDGTGNFSFPTPPLPATGSYTYTLVSATTGSVTSPCSQSLTDSVTISSSPAPAVTMTVLDPQICISGTSNTVQIRFDGTPDTLVNYTFESTTPLSVTIPTSGTITVTPPNTFTVAGTYTYELVDATSTVAPFCSKVQTGTGVVNAVVGPTATIAATAPAVCSGGTTSINFTGTPNASVYYSIAGVAQTAPVVLTPSTTNPLIGEASFVTAALNANTTYELIRVVTAGTPSCETIVTDAVTVNVNPLPTATISPDVTICSGTSTTLTVTGTPNSTVVYTLNSGTNTNLTIGAGGTATITTAVLTADATYRLLSITDAATCTRTLNGVSVVRVAPLPTASFTALPNICSNRSAEITFTGTPNATVNFTYTDGTTTVADFVLLDGAGGNLYTTTPITATTTFNLVSVVSLANGSTPSCTANIGGSLTITPVAAPLINYAVTPLEVCDDNIDGIFEFDLNSKKNEITFANPGLVVTFYETYENSEDGYPSTAIDTSINYPTRDDASPEFPRAYYIYVRVEEPGGSTCPSLTRFRLIVNRTPQAVSPDPIAICDDSSADGFAVFPDLKLREAEMTTALYGADPRAALYSDVYAFEYYLTQPEAEDGLLAGRITSTVSFQNTIAYAQTIWVRVINISNATRCFKVVPLQLIVRELPVVAPATEYSLCDDATEDGIRAFDLEDYKTQITTQPGMSVKYYFDNAAVTSGTELSMTMVDGRLQYINQVPSVQTIVAIVTNESQDTKCSTRVTVTLRVLQNPFITMPAQIPTECDADGNGTADFDLDSLKDDIRAGADYTITFHETIENATDNLYPYGLQVDGSGNPVLDGSGNTIPVPYPSLINGNIWIRATDNVTGCFSVAPLQLIVNPVPEVPAGGVLPQLISCDVNEDQQMRLNLRAHAEAHLLPQTAPGTYVITLHNSLLDAETPTGALIPDTNYPSINGQIVWVRIENTATGCYNTASFEVIINPAKFFIPKQFSVCDSSLPNDGQALFPSSTGVFGDLDSLMTEGLSGYDVIYYTNTGNLIDKTVPYLNIGIPFENIQVTIIDQVTGCISLSRLTLRVEPLPNPRTDPQDIEVCDNGTITNDGIAENIDLTVNETYIRNGASPITVAFYYYNDINLADIDAAANAISNVGFTNALATPTNYSGPSGTIYVLMTTNPSSTSPLAVKCSARVEFELIVNPLPALGVAGVIPDYVLCVGGSTATFPLQAHNATVIESGLNVSDYTFTYYDSQINAEGGTAVGLLNNSYTNTANPEEIWVRVVNNATLCVNVGSFDLIVDEPAVANPVTNPALITKCDTDGVNDGFTDFDLTTLDSSVLGSQTPGDFTVHYYTDEPSALLDGAEGITSTNPLAITNLNPFNTNTRLIYALVINRTSTTGCPDIVPIPLTVDKLPEVTLTGGFFCFDPATNLPIGTFDLFANVDPAAGSYTFEWTKDGVAYPVPDNTQNPITVNERGSYSVVVTNTVTGCISEPAPAVTVERTSTAVATASVTGYFTDNATITVIVDASSLGAYEFQLDEGAYQDSNVFTNVATGTHTINIRDKNASDCAASDPIEVTVINYPKYFTPNGDGIHDTWTIAGLGETAKIYIFDRYGKLIKQIASGENPGDGWNGTMNGQLLPATDYWFRVEYLENNVMKEFKAHFSLKR